MIKLVVNQFYCEQVQNIARVFGIKLRSFNGPLQQLTINNGGEWITKQITLERSHDPNNYQTFIWTIFGFYLVIA
jgi:hypothetical protein